MKHTNSAALTGFLLCLTALVFGVATNGGIGSVLHLLHLPSAIVTFGGALCAALMTADSFTDFRTCLRSFRDAFRKPKEASEILSEQLLSLADVARREGLLALEEQAQSIENEFLKKGVLLMTDGSDPALVRDILETEAERTDEEGRHCVKFWQDLGAFGPAWGMIGTLLGLINMMRDMGSDPAGIGAGMSLALITTLYGSILANWICIPVARKLEKCNDANLLLMQICIEGVLSIQAGENPRIIKEKLNAVIFQTETQFRTASESDPFAA